MTTKLIIPILNNNGDTKDTLMADLSHVREKLDQALKALQSAGASYAHGRNYQLNPAGEGREAYQQHAWRVDKLAKIAHELLEIQYEISQQGK